MKEIEILGYINLTNEKLDLINEISKVINIYPYPIQLKIDAMCITYSFFSLLFEKQLQKFKTKNEFLDNIKFNVSTDLMVQILRCLRRHYNE